MQFYLFNIRPKLNHQKLRKLHVTLFRTFSTLPAACWCSCLMHYSAKRGVEIASHLSVMLVDQGHIGWKSWKLIAQTLIPTPSFFVAQRPSTCSQRNMGNVVEIRGLVVNA